MFYSKKGSTSVFLVISLASLMLLSSVLIRAAGLAAGRSYGDAAFQLAGRSLLSEFDRRLFDDYGLFGMRADEESAAKKLRYYSDASLNRGAGKARGSVWLMPCKVGDVSIDLKQYSLIDINVFEQQMLDDAKYAIAQNLKEALLPDREPVDDGKGQDGDRLGSRTIQNEAVINGLPSKGLGDSGIPIKAILDNGIPSPAELLSGTGDSFLAMEYILSRFAAANTKIPKLAAGHDRFFRNEVEYIIIGKPDDKKNRGDAMFRIKLLRFALNEVTLHTDAEMIEKVAGVTEFIISSTPPGPWTPFIGEMVIAAWCAVETENDGRLLEGGEKVPIYKKAQNWAMDAGSVIAAIMDFVQSDREPGMTAGIKDQAKYNVKGANAIKPRTVEGFQYVDYLRVLLFFTPRETKLLRAMDLMQLNLKMGYYGDFLMHEHFAGIKYQVVMNDDTYVYEQKYRKD